MTNPPYNPYDGQTPPGQPGQYAGGQIQPGYNPYGQGPTGQSGYRFALPGRPAGYTTRVGAALIDSVLQGFPMGIGLIVLIATAQTHPSTANAALGVGGLCSFIIWFLNRVLQQGRTGQSLGKKMTGIRIVSLQSGELIGFGANLGRELLAYFFNYICFLNLLWPLWDEKQQTWHDKVVSDIVVET